MNSTEKSMSEKRILNPFKKSNSQELSRFIPTIPDENRYRKIILFIWLVISCSLIAII